MPVRGLRLATPSGRRALSLARSLGLQLPYARRHPQLAAAQKTGLVAVVNIRVRRMLVEMRAGDAHLSSEWFYKAMHPLGGANSSLK